MTAARIAIAQASRILVGEGILDAFGHVSCRTPKNPETFLISRSMAPGLVTPDEIVELDFEGEAITAKGARLFLERFIHAEIYRRSPEVQAVVHSHALSVLPFASVRGAQVHAISHMCGFLHGTPAPFDVADHAGPSSNLLISNSELGRAFAGHMHGSAVALMRGHGYTTTGVTIAQAVFRAVYTARNCAVQQAAMTMGEPIYLTASEAEACDATSNSEIDRAWNFWVDKHAATIG